MTVPYYVIGASPGKATRVRGFFRDGSDSPGSLLTASAVFRYAGFDTFTGGYAKLIDGERWEVQNRDRKLLQLYPDGTLLFRVRADQDFLGWGQDPARFEALPALNPIAVVESHTSFVHLYRALLSRFLVGTPSVVFKLQFHSAQVAGRRIAITKLFDRGIVWAVDPELYPIHDFNATADAKVETNELIESPNAVAFGLLLKFYDMFDADHELIPFVKTDTDPKAIDVEQLQALSR